jgi:hypothetical protein
MRNLRLNLYVAATLCIASMLVLTPTGNASAIGPQYDTAHVYVNPEDFDRFVQSILATFGGTTSKRGTFTVTPTKSLTMSQLVLTPAGTLSVFGFTTPIPYPFGAERTGYLVEDMANALALAQQAGADVEVESFPDPIGKDAVIEWPGGVHTQLYWHTTAPSYQPLTTVPENRVYLSEAGAQAFVKAFNIFSKGRVVEDLPSAPGEEIGKPGTTFHEMKLSSVYGKVAVLITDGHLPYPYGREIFGYEVSDLATTIDKATHAGAVVLVDPYDAGQRRAVMLQFPGGYIAEVHADRRGT